MRKAQRFQSAIQLRLTYYDNFWLRIVNIESHFARTNTITDWTTYSLHLVASNVGEYKLRAVYHLNHQYVTLGKSFLCQSVAKLICVSIQLTITPSLPSIRIYHRNLFRIPSDITHETFYPCVSTLKNRLELFHLIFLNICHYVGK